MTQPPVLLDLLHCLLLVSVSFLQVLTVWASLAASQVWVLQAVLVFLVSVLALVLLAEKALAYSVALALALVLVLALGSVGELGLVLRFALSPPALSQILLVHFLQVPILAQNRALVLPLLERFLRSSQLCCCHLLVQLFLMFG